MSFDVYVSRPACSHCGRGEETAWEFNLTHNLNSIVESCLVRGAAMLQVPLVTGGSEPRSAYADRSWGRLHRHTVGEVKELLRAARKVAFSAEYEAEYLALEPENKWGTLGSVREMLGKFVERIDAGEFEDGWIVEARG